MIVPKIKRRLILPFNLRKIHMGNTVISLFIRGRIGVGHIDRFSVRRHLVSFCNLSHLVSFHQLQDFDTVIVDGDLKIVRSSCKLGPCPGIHEENIHSLILRCRFNKGNHIRGKRFCRKGDPVGLLNFILYAFRYHSGVIDALLLVMGCCHRKIGTVYAHGTHFSRMFPLLQMNDHNIIVFLGSFNAADLHIDIAIRLDLRALAVKETNIKGHIAGQLLAFFKLLQKSRLHSGVLPQVIYLQSFRLFQSASGLLPDLDLHAAHLCG